MGEAKVGEQFIKHEFDEAIAIQRTIVEAEEQLAEQHPEPDTQKAMRQGLKDSQKFLNELERLGGKHGATGKVEDVAGSL